jgi:hypothetical protein
VLQRPAIMVYQYTTLNGVNEIRLVDLLPDESRDDIQLTMRYATLNAPKADESREIILKGELQKSLPVGWDVHETLEGRFIFERTGSYKPDEAYETS